MNNSADADTHPHIGGGLVHIEVISLLFALTSDVELACESCVQAGEDAAGGGPYLWGLKGAAASCWCSQR